MLKKFQLLTKLTSYNPKNDDKQLSLLREYLSSSNITHLPDYVVLSYSNFKEFVKSSGEDVDRLFSESYFRSRSSGVNLLKEFKTLDFEVLPPDVLAIILRYTNSASFYSTSRSINTMSSFVFEIWQTRLSLFIEKPVLLAVKEAAKSQKIDINYQKLCRKVEQLFRFNENRKIKHPWQICLLTGDVRLFHLAESNFGLSATSTDEYGITPLHIAALSGSEEVLGRALSMGINPRITDSDNANILHFAALSGSVSQLEFSLTLGIPVENVDARGYGVIHCAALSGNPEQLKRVVIPVEGLPLGNPDSKTSSGDNFVHFSAKSGYTRQLHCALALANELNDKKRCAIDPYASDDLARTLLHFAVLSGSPEQVQKTLDLGVDPKAQDYQFRSALDYLQLRGLKVFPENVRTEIARLIQSPVPARATRVTTFGRFKNFASALFVSSKAPPANGGSGGAASGNPQMEPRRG